MRINKGDKLTNHSPIDNDIKRVFFEDSSELDYGDFAVYVYIVMNVQYGENGADGKPNGKQGYCYKTKKRIKRELKMSRGKFDKSIARLIEYGFIGTREEPNKYGGRPLVEYRLSSEWKARI